MGFLESKWWEEYYPIITGIVSGVIFLLVSDPISTENAKGFFDKSVDVCAIAVGFLGTAQAILLSLEHRKVIQQLKPLGHYDAITKYLNEGIYWCLASAVFFTWCLFKTPNGSVSVYSTFWFSISFFFAVVSGLTCFRVIQIFSKILKLHK